MAEVTCTIGNDEECEGVQICDPWCGKVNKYGKEYENTNFGHDWSDKAGRNTQLGCCKCPCEVDGGRC